MKPALSLFPGNGSPPPAMSTRRATGGSFDPSVDEAIIEAASEAGIDPDTLRTFARIESGGNPTVRTGSYKGLFQLSDKEFSKHGGQGDIYDARENARVAALKLKAESEDFKRSYGREPTPAEIYMIHQQGVGGSAAHWANPDAPAWQNMYSTAEGRKKGPGWARQAIWGNVPNDVKKKYGSVDNMTSRDFLDMWGGKFRRMSLGGPKETDTQSPLPVVANASPPAPMPSEGEKPMAETLPWSNMPAQGASGGGSLSGGSLSPAALEFATGNVKTRRQKELAKMLMGIAGSDRPVGGTLDGVMRVVSGLVGGHAAVNSDNMSVGQQELMAKVLGGNLSPIEQFAFATGNDDLIKTVIANRMKPAGSDLTSAQKDYLYGEQNPDFRKYQLETLGASKQESGYAGQRGKDLAGEVQKIRNEESAARASLNSIQSMRSLMTDPNFYSGVGNNVDLLLKQTAAAFGFRPEAAASMEAFKAASNQLIMGGLNGSLGNGVSNADRSFIENTVANLSVSEAGNKAILDMKERIDQRKIQVAELMDTYLERSGQLDDRFFTELRQWADANPLFGPGEALYQRGKKSPQSFLPQQPQEVAPPTEQQTPAQSALPDGWSYKGAR